MEDVLDLVAEVSSSAQLLTIKAEDIVNVLGNIKHDSEFEKWAISALASFSDHGYQGGRLPSYVDLELLHAIEIVCRRRIEDPSIHDRIDLQLDRMPEAPYGLLHDLSKECTEFQQKLPIDLRYRFLYQLLGSVLTKPRTLRRLPLFKGVPEESMLPLEHEIAVLIRRVGESGFIVVGNSKRDIATQTLAIMSNLKSETGD